MMDLLFTEPPEMEYIEPKLDFELDPHHFIKWLEAEAETDDYLDFSHGSYHYMVSNMCEYSCLYVAMLLYREKLEGELRIIDGKFGFWGHYWLKYTLGEDVYFIDLTLQQFVKEAPKLAITKAHNNRTGYNDEFDPEGILIRDYADSKEAFDFYLDPQSVF